MVLGQVSGPDYRGPNTNTQRFGGNSTLERGVLRKGCHIDLDRVVVVQQAETTMPRREHDLSEGLPRTAVHWSKRRVKIDKRVIISFAARDPAE